MSEENKGIEVVKHEASLTLMWAEELEVRNESDYKSVFEVVKQIKVIRNKWLGYWGKIKKDAYNTWKDIKEKENEVVKICDETERMAKDKAGSWRAKQEAIAEEQRRKLQAEADRRARIERERLEKEAEKLKTPELKEQRLEEAAAVIAPEVKVESPAKVEGVSVRKSWKAKLVNMGELILNAKPGSVASTLVGFNQMEADAFARSTKGNVKVPGVEFYTKDISFVRGGKNE